MTTERTEIRLGSRNGVDVTMAFRRIPSGKFLMGSRGDYSDQEPVHQVVIDGDFWLGETPVTQAQFAVWTEAADVEHANEFPDRPHHPAENMNWHEATAYCQWLGDQFQSQLPGQHRVATLPSEAQWEYACRAGTTTDYHTGDGEAALRQAGWFGEDWEKGHHSVGDRRLLANDWGLRDMHGNVWEWCRDRWDGDAYRRRWAGITAAETLELAERFGEQGDDGNRVLRGGAWYYTADNCRSAARVRNWAVNRNWYVGLRVCLVRSP